MTLVHETGTTEGRRKRPWAQALSALSGRAEPDEDHTWVSFRHCLKAAGVVDGVCQGLRDRGFTQVEVRTVYPALLHVEALVYRGDLAYEESQKQGSSAPSTAWKSGIEEILDSFGMHDDGLWDELEELDRYFRDESRIVLRLPQMTEALILETCYRRSSDMRLLVRLAHELTQRPGAEGYIRCSRPSLVLEIWSDLLSYEKDVAEDSFNTLRVFGWVYGKDRAGERLKDWMESLHNDCVAELARAERAVLVGHWRTRLIPPIDAVRLSPRRHFVRLSYLPPRLLPRRFLVRSATRHLESVKLDFGTVIPQMVDDPPRAT